MKKLNTRMITVIGVLIAMEVILSRFLSINAPSVKIGFAFVPCALCAVLFGLAPTVIMRVFSFFIWFSPFVWGLPHQEKLPCGSGGGNSTAEITSFVRGQLPIPTGT